MQYLIPIIILLASGGIFFTLIGPLNEEVEATRTQSALLEDALNNTRRIQSIRDDLLDRFNAISVENIDKVEKLLPDNVDNVRLILEVDKVASRYGMLIRDISITSPEEESEDILGPNEEVYGSIDVQFSISGSYNAFRRFIVDLEKSLRIVDIRQLSFSVAEEGFVSYSLGVRTYWLR